MILFTEYYKEQGRRESAARHLLAVGRFKTAQKIGNRWYIDKAEPYPAARDFRNLDFKDRQLLETYIRKGLSKAECARRLGYYRSTITREVRRGLYEHTLDLTTETRYSCDKAQTAHEEHFSAMGPQLKIGNDHKLAKHIENKILNEKRSPAEILGEIERDNLTFATRICVATLYSYIDKQVFANVRREHLPEGGRRKRKYTHVVGKRPPKGDSIDNRPVEVDTRETAFDWEGDTIKGEQGTKECCYVLTERKTREEIIIPLPNGKSETVVSMLDDLERNLGAAFPLIFRSIMVDNGGENANFAGMELSLSGGKRTKVYYCHPYRSSERGSNENQNRQIRRKIPKGTRFKEYSPEYVAEVQNWLNSKPRKILGWKTAEMAFTEELAALGVDVDACLRAISSQKVYN
jgi:IS30 family transposase